MALPADFSKIYGSAATGGLTPISDVDYAKGWEYVGGNPPTKNDFSYLQNLSDRKAQYLYKAIGGDSGAPAIGIPFFWTSASMPNDVLPEWSHMVFLKFNGSTFSATTYPKLALVIPSLTLPDVRGEFPRFWDDGRGVDAARSLLSFQAATSITDYHGNGGLMPKNYINNDDGQYSAGPTFTSYGSQGDGTNGNTTYFNMRPRNVAFNFLVRAK